MGVDCILGNTNVKNEFDIKKIHFFSSEFIFKRIENLRKMFNSGFYINDLSMHDSSRDLVLVGTQKSTELKATLEYEKQKSKALEANKKKLDIEMAKSDTLLNQMMPIKIIERMRNGEQVMDLCQMFTICTVMFSRIIGFVDICKHLTPLEIVNLLNTMYTKFDKALEGRDIYKVETIGDSYLIVSGVPERTENHAIEIVEMGFEMLNLIVTIKNPLDKSPLKIRLGAHSGPVVGVSINSIILFYFKAKITFLLLIQRVLLVLERNKVHFINLFKLKY
jgi:guanylate cyclase, other